MTPGLLPSLDPSEASETSSLLLTSLLSPLKKDDNEPVASSMYMERPDLSWSLCLAPAKKNGGVEPEEESETREGTGLMRGGVSPCQEFGGGTGIGVARPDWTDSEAKPPLSAIASAPTRGAGGVVEVNKDGLSRNPMFNDKVTKGGSNLFQGD